MIEPGGMISILILGIVSAFASFVGALSGGAAVLVIPALVFAGLPVHVAIGTSRIGAIGMMLTGGYQFYRSGKLHHGFAILITLMAATGSVVGAMLLPNISSNSVSKLLGVVVITIGLSTFYFHRKKVILEQNRNIKLTLKKIILGLILFYFVGFWGGFIGAGYAIIAQYILTAIFGYSYLDSAGISKVLGFGISICASIAFGLQQLIDWRYGIYLAFCMAIGSHYGSYLGIKKGEIWTQKVFILGSVMFGVILLFN